MHSYFFIGRQKCMGTKPLGSESEGSTRNDAGELNTKSSMSEGRLGKGLI